VIDSHEVHQLVDAINKASRVAPAEVAGIVKRGAQNVKTDMRRRWSGMPHARLLPYAVTYDTYVSLKGPAAEIGPDKSRPQGPLGSLLEYGSINNQPIPAAGPAADAEEPRFTAALEMASVKALDL
jgi:hypothetical protein